jgi:ribosomal protein L7Ae-like RNA K-turn-binding protein
MLISEKEELQRLVDESSSLTDILRKQGKSVSGTTVKILKNKLDEYGIQYFFIKEKDIIGKKIELSEILKKDRPYRSSALKQRLIEEGLKEDVCEICNQGPIWNGKPLTLQLDHINGDHNDNRIENLRILCPNCHTQTETFGSKKTKYIKLCVDCGKPISHRSIRCVSCAKKHRKTTYKVEPENQPSKDELLKLIQTKSFEDIGRMYGVSSTCIRKWCKKRDLPYTKQQVRDLIYKK